MTLTNNIQFIDKNSVAINYDKPIIKTKLI